MRNRSKYSLTEAMGRAKKKDNRVPGRDSKTPKPSITRDNGASSTLLVGVTTHGAAGTGTISQGSQGQGPAAQKPAARNAIVTESAQHSYLATTPAVGGHSAFNDTATVTLDDTAAAEPEDFTPAQLKCMAGVRQNHPDHIVLKQKIAALRKEWKRGSEVDVSQHCSYQVQHPLALAV